MIAFSHAQPQPPTTERQARYYVYGAFLTHAVPEIMGERVALGPELEQRLGLAAGADRLTIYDALMTYTDGKPLNVRRASADEVARYKPRAKRELKDPLFAVQAGDITLLVEYDMQANTIPFVGQIDVAYQPPRAAPPPVVERRSAPPVAVIEPKPVAPKPAPPPVAAVPKPAPPPVATAPRPVAPKPAPPAVAKPQARVAPPAARPPAAEPELRSTGPCEVKPVMSEQDLFNCRATATIAPRINPGAPPVAPRSPNVAAPPERRLPTPCVIKPVMSEEDLIACRR